MLHTFLSILNKVIMVIVVLIIIINNSNNNTDNNNNNRETRKYWVDIQRGIILSHEVKDPL